MPKLEQRMPMHEPKQSRQELEQRMQPLGQRMRQHGVRDILFVHGTFAGYDPLGFFLEGYDGAFYRRIFDQITSMFLPGGIPQLQDLIKQGIDARVGDMGNFLRS
jgi:hypothetical protein